MNHRNQRKLDPPQSSVSEYGVSARSRRSASFSWNSLASQVARRQSWSSDSHSPAALQHCVLTWTAAQSERNHACRSVTSKEWAQENRAPPRAAALLLKAAGMNDLSHGLWLFSLRSLRPPSRVGAITVRALCEAVKLTPVRAGRAGSAKSGEKCVDCLLG